MVLFLLLLLDWFLRPGRGDELVGVEEAFGAILGDGSALLSIDLHGDGSLLFWCWWEVSRFRFYETFVPVPER